MFDTDYLRESSAQLEVKIEEPNKQASEQEAISTEVLKYSNTKKLVKDFVVFDFETTGLSHVENKIIQIAEVRYVDFVETEKFVTYVKLVNGIPAKITKINGITNADVRHTPGIKEALAKLLNFIGNDVLVAYNASFDMKFSLAINMYNHQFEALQGDRHAVASTYIETPNHKLPTLKALLNLDHLNSHEALHDCYIAGGRCMGIVMGRR